MYCPSAFREHDASRLHKIIRARSFGTLAALVGSDIHFAYAPVVIRAAGDDVRLRLHLAKANPLAELDAVPAKMSFVATDAYVSPDWYVSPGFVPTWNYVAVEAAGRLVRLDRDATLGLLKELSADQEERLRPKPSWTFDKVPEAKREALLNAIVGFELRVENLEGKLKLSQDKAQIDAAGVIRNLEARDDPRSHEIAALARRANGL